MTCLICMDSSSADLQGGEKPCMCEPKATPPDPKTSQRASPNQARQELLAGLLRSAMPSTNQAQPNSPAATNGSRSNRSSSSGVPSGGSSWASCLDCQQGSGLLALNRGTGKACLCTTAKPGVPPVSPIKTSAYRYQGTNDLSSDQRLQKLAPALSTTTSTTHSVSPPDPALPSQAAAAECASIPSTSNANSTPSPSEQLAAGQPLLGTAKLAAGQTLETLAENSCQQDQDPQPASAPALLTPRPSTSSALTVQLAGTPASVAAASMQANGDPPHPMSASLRVAMSLRRQRSSVAGLIPLSSPSTGGAVQQPPSGYKKTFYKRQLPSPPCTAFSSGVGKALFQEAMADGGMNGFFKLMEQFSTQDEPAFCGLASIAMTLNALAIDPRRSWKGVWRWFNEAMLDCCRPLDSIKESGITLHEAACLARCNGAHVEVHRHGTFSLEQFREHVQEACRSGDEHVIVNYSRRNFLQTGDGHFSPIGGYHADKDLVLILDVARFKYPPHWVPLPTLFDSMSALDSATQQPRGYLLLSAQHLLDSVLLTLDVHGEAWCDADDFVRLDGCPELQALARQGPLPPAAAVSALVGGAPRGSVDAFVAVRDQSGMCAARHVPWEQRLLLLGELRTMPLYQHVRNALGLASAPPQPSVSAAQLREQHLPVSCLSDNGFLAEKLCIMALLRQPAAWAQTWQDPSSQAGWEELHDLSNYSLVAAEVQYLREQMVHIEEVLASGQLDPVCCGQEEDHHCASSLDCATHGFLAPSLANSSLL